MPTERAFRFTIGRLMAVTAILAVLLAGAFSSPVWGGGLASLLHPRFLAEGAIALSSIVVCFLNLRLSPYIRVMIGGLVASFLAYLMLMFLIYSNPDPSQSYLSTLLGLLYMLQEVSHLVFIWGLYLTFHDLKDRLMGPEARPRDRLVGPNPDPWAPPAEA
jgi:hypothetical protein